MEASTTALVPVSVIALTSAVVIRRGYAWLARRFGGQYFGEESDDEFVEGEEELLPQPEPLGGYLTPPKRSSRTPSVTSASYSPSPRQRHCSTTPPPQLAQSVPFSYEKHRQELPLEWDAAALRARLIDADAAKRRAMARMAELERETESLRRRCAELERKVISDNLQSLGKVFSDNFQALGVSQRILTMAVPQFKYRGRGLFWS